MQGKKMLKNLAHSFADTQFGKKLKYFVLVCREKKYESLDEEKKRQELCKWYLKHTGKKLNLECPQEFNEKIQWLKLYDNTAIKTVLSDKYLVRDWVKEQIGDKYLIPIYGVWENAAAIDFEKLPKAFVLKANHGSAMNIVVKDKTAINRKKALRACASWLKTPYDLSGMEQQYYAIPRRIIAEKYIEQTDGDLCDYKIHCFNGHPRIIQVIGNRNLKKHTGNEAFFDTNWNLVNFKHHTYKQYDIPPKAPKCLDEMLEAAGKLSSSFKYVRVDMYILQDGVKFGEMTFTPAAGIGKWGSEMKYSSEIECSREH